MFEIVTFKNTVRVPPKYWKGNIKEGIKEALASLEGKYSKIQGLLLRIIEVKEIGEGKILPGDGAVYFPVTYDALVFRPKLNEVVEGEVVDIVEFGAFVRIAAFDGLIHISQIAEDYFSYSKEGVLQGRESKKVIKLGDKVRARIISIPNPKNQNELAKLGLTMRQPGLGKLEWLAEERGDAKEK